MDETVKRAIEFGNFRYKVVCLFLEKIGYSNHTLHKLEVRNKVYRYIKHKYGFVVDEYKESKHKEPNNEDVWICWFQGVDNAPEVVRKCVESAQYWLKDKKIHLLDESNIYEYIDLPDYIMCKWRSGLISNTLFSDFVRLSILKQFGGIWIDATVFFTGSLPAYIENNDFFMYRTPLEDECKVGESWFIKAPARDDLICLTLDILCEYWKKEKKIKDYFIMFICMKIASEKVGTIKERTIEIPNRLPLIMERYLNDIFDWKTWDDICKLTPIHKLNYKRLDNTDESFLQYILESEVGELTDENKASQKE